MFAQYYREDKTIRIFAVRDAIRMCCDIYYKDRGFFGLPPFKEWDKTDWGYEYEFNFLTIKLKEDK